MINFAHDLLEQVIYMDDREQYINFDEYIRQGEPSQREAAYAWSTAIGLQAVDGLKTSDYLNDLARRNIEGEITIDEVDKFKNKLRAGGFALGSVPSK